MQFVNETEYNNAKETNNLCVIDQYETQLINNKIYDVSLKICNYVNGSDLTELVPQPIKNDLKKLISGDLKEKTYLILKKQIEYYNFPTKAEHVYTKSGWLLNEIEIYGSTDK